MTFTNAKQRFSNRVEDYVRYRPGYPLGILAFLSDNCCLHARQVIADIGSGTGLLSKLFLDNGNHVYGVEPNAEMYAAGEEFLRNYPNFAGVKGSAEVTTLADHSVDFVVAGQAFHWFNPAVSRAEFSRILKPGGWVVVVWNERLLDTTPFLRDYEALLHRFGTDYAKVNDSYPRQEQMLSFFGSENFLSHQLPNLQEFDFAGLSGRLRSSSYAPAADQPNFQEMMNELQHIFTAYQQDGKVRFDYRTRVYAGTLHHDGN